MNIKNIQVLFRTSSDTKEEYEICKKYLPTNTIRTECEDSLIIGRYSVLPFYKEVEQDLANLNCNLINNYNQHTYIADFQYYFDIEEYTPKTYFSDWQYLPDKKFIVKGVTNSRKFDWKTKMFAENKQQAINIALELMNDYSLQQQNIIIREFEDFEVLEEGITGMPFLNEHRLFYIGDQLLSHGFYWSISEKKAQLEQKGIDFANMIAKIVCNNTNAFVIDIAKLKTGEWRVIEINDLQMSGLSDNQPEKLYSSIASLIKDIHEQNTKII